MRTSRSAQPSPWAQSYRIAFYTLYAGTLLAAIGWFFSSTYRISPENQAVIFHFGQPSRIAGSGLLLAWPRPVDRVVKIPGAERIIEYPVHALSRESQLAPLSFEMIDGDAGTGAGYLLTGDTGIVALDVRLFYRITEPVHYALQQSHLSPLLNRLAARAATVVSAGRNLDSILVARPEQLSNVPEIAAQRLRLRGDFKDEMNRSLLALSAPDTDPGIIIERVDIESALPEQAASAFNAVLTASQNADKIVADARNTAELRLQQARQNADQTLQQAQSASQEIIARARIDTETIQQLANSQDKSLLQRMYRQELETIFARAGRIISIMPGDEAHLILQQPESRSSSNSEKQP